MTYSTHHFPLSHTFKPWVRKWDFSLQREQKSFTSIIGLSGIKQRKNYRSFPNSSKLLLTPHNRWLVVLSLSSPWLHISAEPNTELLLRLGWQGFLPPTPLPFPTSYPQLTVHQHASLLSNMMMLRLLSPCPWHERHPKVCEPSSLPGPRQPHSLGNLSCNRFSRCFWHLAHIPGLLLQTCSPFWSSSFVPAVSNALSRFLRHWLVLHSSFSSKRACSNHPMRKLPPGLHWPSGLPVCIT